jgi:hypothetical protein
VSQKSQYYSYLLRVWVSGEKGKLEWRVLLEDTRNGERLGFSSLERLFAFLEDQTRPLPGDELAPPRGSW